MGTHYRGKAREVRALDALIKLSRCAWSLSSRLEAPLRDEGFTANQFGLLEALLHLGPLEPCDVGPKLLTSRTNVMLLIDQLEERGLVRRTPVKHDRRRVLLELTAEGKRVAEKAFARHLQRLVAEMSRLTPTEQEELARLCKLVGKPH
jgi:MarR family 2-MHQ and catechol resistance regulon transcriptional repressor